MNESSNYPGNSKYITVESFENIASGAKSVIAKDVVFLINLL